MSNPTSTTPICDNARLVISPEHSSVIVSVVPYQVAQNLETALNDANARIQELEKVRDNFHSEFGERLVEFFMLKPARRYDGKNFNPVRFYTIYGTKTAQGVGASVQGILEVLNNRK